MIYTTKYNSPIGEMLLASDGDSLIGLWNHEQKYFGSPLLKESKPNDQLPILIKTKDWLDKYFSGRKPDSKELPLSMAGSDFRQRVWKILLDIPYGKTVTYGDISKQIAKQFGKPKMSAQAVGGAVGHNPISIIVPCHRVIGSNGSLTGYAGGIDMKIKLLELEGHEVSNCGIINT